MGIEFDLHRLGWQASFEQSFQPHHDAGFIPARVAEEHRDRYAVFCVEGVREAEVTGRLRYTAAARQDFPAVGDWVALQLNGDSTAIIHAVLPRRTLLLRKAAGMLTEAQVIAANLDTLFIVTDVDKDFNPRRLERYLTIARESGVRPVVVLNKADLNAHAASLVREIEIVAGGATVLAVSALDGNGLDVLGSYVGEGDTVALIGSSGVGKSSIINRLLGEERLKTTQIRDSDGRGRHTTTWRQLLLLPGGGIVIDTPGMREVQLWADEESLDAAFHDIEEIAAECRFADCRHQSEPDCAVRRALEDGTLQEARYASYAKLRRELLFLERKQNTRLRLEEQARWKRISRMSQEHMRMKYGGK
jgi:ribosome biogenesis GTPase